jgi:hypothetical protein
VEIGHEQAMFKLLKILTANTVGIFFARSGRWLRSTSGDIIPGSNWDLESHFGYNVPQIG